MLDLLALFVFGAFADYEVIAVDVTHPHQQLRRTEYTVQVGSDTMNRYAITHVAGKGPAWFGRQPLILLSPFLLPGAFYEIEEDSKYEKSVAGRLARANFDVWLVDQRRSGLASGACESGEADCSVMAEWDFDAYATDALFAAALAGWTSPGRKPVVGGFSAGANTAMAAVNRAPGLFSGLFLYEGTFYSEDSTIVQHNQASCQMLEVALSEGSAYDPGAAVFGAVIGLAQEDPQGLTPIFGFPPGTTNQQALLLVFGAPPPPGAIAPTPDFVRMIADFEEEQFVYSDQRRLTQAGPLFDNYASVAAVRDLACGLAGMDDTHYADLEDFEGDVLMFVGGTGFTQSMFDTLALMPEAASVTIEHHAELGEADAYFHDDWKQVFYQPLKRWLQQHQSWPAEKKCRWKW